MNLGLLLHIVLSCTNLMPPEDSVRRVRQGEVFTISLPSSIGTGYTWQLARPADSTHLTFMSKRYIAANDLDGGPGTDQFTFRAVKKGGFDYASSTYALGRKRCQKTLATRHFPLPFFNPTFFNPYFSHETNFPSHQLSGCLPSGN